MARYFKKGEVTMTHDELLKRQRKHAMDQHFLNKLNRMCRRIKELQIAYKEIESLKE